MADTLAPYDLPTIAAAGRAAAQARRVIKRGREILTVLENQLADLDVRNGQVLRAEDPEAELAKLARSLWSLRHERLAQLGDLMAAVDAAADVYTPLLDSILGDYWPLHPKTGEPLTPGITPLAPQDAAGND